MSEMDIEEITRLFASQESLRLLEEVKRLAPIQTSCPHLRICHFDEKHEYLGWKCYDCNERVYPDPEGLLHGYIEYGRKA